MSMPRHLSFAQPKLGSIPKPPPRPVGRPQVYKTDDLVDLYKKYGNYSEVARHLDCSILTVRKRLLSIPGFEPAKYKRRVSRTEPKTPEQIIKRMSNNPGDLVFYRLFWEYRGINTIRNLRFIAGIKKINSLPAMNKVIRQRLLDVAHILCTVPTDQLPLRVYNARPMRDDFRPQLDVYYYRCGLPRDITDIRIMHNFADDETLMDADFTKADDEDVQFIADQTGISYAKVASYYQWCWDSKVITL